MIKVRAIIARQVFLNEELLDLAGLVLIDLKKEVQLNENFADSDLILDETPEIKSFTGIETPFTIQIDKPLRIKAPELQRKSI